MCIRDRCLSLVVGCMKSLSSKSFLWPIELYFTEKLPLSKICIWTKFSTQETKKKPRKNKIFLGIMKLLEIL